jgi:hypothetical protein
MSNLELYKNQKFRGASLKPGFEVPLMLDNKISTQWFF